MSGGSRGSERADELTQEELRGRTVQMFVKRAMDEGRAPRLAEHKRLLDGAPTIMHSTHNADKNRFANVVLLDDTRVVLKPVLGEETDYVHASHVRVRGRHLVLAQAPMRNTVLEFWRLLWQEKARVVVCLAQTLADVQDGEECFEYWPERKGRAVHFGVGKRFHVRTVAIGNDRDAVVYDLRVTCRENKAKDVRNMQLLHYTRWRAERAAPAVDSLLALVERTHVAEQAATDAHVAPVVVHCDSGGPRAGSFAAMLLCCGQLRASGDTDVNDVCASIQQQRYGTMRSRLHYTLIYATVFEYAARIGLLASDDADLLKFRRQVAPVLTPKRP